MTFESSINRLNYFKIVILIYTDIVLIIQAEIKLFTGADDGELNIKGSSWGWEGRPACARREMIFLCNELAACRDMNLWPAAKKENNGVWEAFAGYSFAAMHQFSCDSSAAPIFIYLANSGALTFFFTKYI